MNVAKLSSFYRKIILLLMFNYYILIFSILFSKNEKSMK